MLTKLTSLIDKNPSNHQNESKNTRCHFFEKIPNDILRYSLFKSIELKAAAIFTQTSRRHHQLFQEQIDHSMFMHHVTYGEQDNAENMLRKWWILKDSKVLNFLLTTKMDITDIAGNKFQKITAFQYALWALDRHMWEMLLRYISPENARYQLNELEDKGLTYIKPAFDGDSEIKIFGEKHFDFSQLLSALKDYLENFPLRNWHQRELQWCIHVGRAQRNLPAHVVAEYCRFDRSFIPTPHFKEKSLPRNLNYFNYALNCYQSWFAPTSDLGNAFAIWRGLGVGVWSRARAGLGGGGGGLDDFNAISTLYSVRMSEFDLLKADLNCMNISTDNISAYHKG